MSKVSFRAKALDATKPMPVYKAEEIPDMKDFAQINRSVPQMPTGMEKEEETEHHLQRALSAQQVYGSSEALVIPIPEVQDIEERYDMLYKSDYKPTKQYIHIQAFNMDQEIPDYDLDSDDDAWLGDQSKKMEMTPTKFEQMMDRLEKGSGQQVVTLQEAKLLLKEDDDLIMAVYDYWLNKRLKMQRPLIATVKSDKRDGTTTNNPYVAFRRRTEKMQTRKNRKNDEVSYEKMLKLRRDLQKALTLLELLKRREKSKKENLQLTIEVMEKRNEMEDFSGAALAEAEEEREKHPTFMAPFALNSRGEWVQSIKGDEVTPVRKKRQYRKRKQSQQQQQTPNQSIPHVPIHHFPQHTPPHSIGDVDIMYSSDEDMLSPALSQSDHEDENDPDGMFAFKRRKHCHYHQTIPSGCGNWPWHGPESGGKGNPLYRFSLTSLSNGCVGYARRRVGRGGRIIFDRASTQWNDCLERLDFVGSYPSSSIESEYITYVRESKIPHFRSKTPPSDEEDDQTNPSSQYLMSSVFHNPHPPSSSSSEFDVESFHCHREQLLEMQREQQQRLLTEDRSTHRSTAITLDLDPSLTAAELSSRFTLDSASAEFAVRALVDSPKLESVPALEGSTPSSLHADAASDPVGSRTNTQQLNFSSLVTGAKNSINNLTNTSSNNNNKGVTGLSSSLSTSSLSGKSITNFINSISSCHTSQSDNSLLSKSSSSLSTLSSVVANCSSVLSSSVSNSSSTNHHNSIIPILVSPSTCTASTVGSTLPLSSAATILLTQTIKTNGPLSSSLVKSTGLSTSPAANVLQLNFPTIPSSSTTVTPSSINLSSLSLPTVTATTTVRVTPISSLSSSTVVAAVAPSSSSSSATAISTLPVMSSGGATAASTTTLHLQRSYTSGSVANNSKLTSPATAGSTGSMYRLPVAAAGNFDILKSNHEEAPVILFNKEAGIPMDVT